MADYRKTSGGIHKQAESHHEWSVILVENLLPGKKATARFILLDGNYHDWAAQDADTSPPMVVFNEDEDITVVDHNDCTCALTDEILKVTFNSDVGAFVPVGSSGLVRQAIVDDTIDYGDSGDVFLARCGTQISPTVTVTAHNCHNDSGSAVSASSKVIIAYIQGFEDNTVYRAGNWHIISEVPRKVLIKAPTGGIPQRVGTLMGSASCDVYAASSSGVISDTTENITVWNWGTTAACANGDRYGWAEYRHPLWWVVSEDCGDEGSQINAPLSLISNDTSNAYSESITSSTLVLIPRTVTYTAPVGVVPT